MQLLGESAPLPKKKITFTSSEVIFEAISGRPPSFLAGRILIKILFHNHMDVQSYNGLCLTSQTGSIPVQPLTDSSIGMW